MELDAIGMDLRSRPRVPALAVRIAGGEGRDPAVVPAPVELWKGLVEEGGVGGGVGGGSGQSRGGACEEAKPEAEEEVAGTHFMAEGCFRW